MNIAFIGPRRAGKSFISKELSKIVDYPLLSTDSIASYELGGISIQEFIKNHSWEEFRNLEFTILQKLKNSKNIILDCGGGFIFDIHEGKECLSQRKVNILKTKFTVFYITRNFEELIEKKNNLNHRPSLDDKTHYSEILKRRFEHYKAVSDYTFNFEKKNVSLICKKINQIINLTK